jgi:outer membrane immunogenic protein
VDLRTDAGAFIPNTSYFTAPENIASVNRNGSGSLNLDEVVGGVQVGTSLQSGQFVVGLEADFGSFNIGGSKGVTGFTYPVFAPPADYTMRASMSTDWLVTGRARLGWTPQPNVLLYATGGIAVTNLHVSNTFSDNAPSQGVGGSSASETLVGWTLGAGGELALSREWSIKAEYLFLDFGSVATKGSVFCGPAVAAICTGLGFVPSPYTSSADLSAHIARIGLNHRF